MAFNLLKTTEDFFRSRDIPTKSFASTASTTVLAKEAAATEQAPVAVYLAGQQTSGRGRGQNSWVSNPGDSILISISFAVEKNPQPIMAPVIGLAMFEALSETWPKLNFSLKAPNDIYLAEKKLVGILLEVIDGSSKRLVLSFGFNVLSSPKEISTATSLKEHHPNVSAEEIKIFLSRLLLNFQSAVVEGSQIQIAKNSCDKICKALNSNPNLIEKVLRLEPDGSIHFASGYKRWQDL